MTVLVLFRQKHVYTLVAIKPSNVKGVRA